MTHSSGTQPNGANGAALTGVSLLATIAFVFFIDRGQTITGAAALPSQRTEIMSVRTAAGD